MRRVIAARNLNTTAAALRIGRFANQRRLFDSSSSYVISHHPQLSSFHTVRSAFREKTIEQKYQRKTPIEHVLERPDTYVGSVERQAKSMFVLEKDDNGVRVINKQISYVPALYKIIDELLVNAVDNHHRAKTGTDELRVEIDESSDGLWLHIYNNGKTIPVQIHKEEKLYVPELVFGHLLTGSNFDDTEVKLTGGRNGYGAKLANIFSEQFIVEVSDPAHGLSYKQHWSQNMGLCSPAEITQITKTRKVSAGSIKVSIKPDLSRFSNFENQEQKADFLALLRRRVYDLAACNTSLNVYLNNELIPVRGFSEYVKLFYDNASDVNYKKINEHLEIALGPSISAGSKVQTNDFNDFTHFSFVNSIATSNGGTHISHISNIISRKILEHVKKHQLYKEHEFKASGNSSSDTQFLKIILSQISLFANVLLENPTFDSQTKETLTSKVQQFTRQFQISQGGDNEKKIDDLVKQFVSKTTIVEDILSVALFKQERRNKVRSIKEKTSGGKLVIPKLDDANWAGGPKASECTLILTEGDSAKALAVAGLSVIGRDKYGVFPLKGKLLNVRDAKADQISNNAEIINLKKILGLDGYDDRSGNKNGLRYGRVMLMCDQDHDGSHIKGLFINFLHYFYPNLLRSGFVEIFITPIIKVTHKKEIHSFFSLGEYHTWRDNLIATSGQEEYAKCRVKYYKGLGTSTSLEAKEYFSRLNQKHRIVFEFNNNEAEKDDKLVEMAFSKTQAQLRKEWLAHFKTSTLKSEDTYFDRMATKISLSDFFNKEFIHFSNYDNVRSIPSLVDGLKPSQRKVLYASLTKRAKSSSNSEIKVAQLAGYVSETTAYHHGEVSLNSTIINMAQDFVGSGNNIPLLYPSGQFGTRLQGGKDAASARYIFTRINGFTRHIFNELDDQVLEYNEEEGIQIEPRYFVPIIPMVLVNGAEGLGTGWSTYIPTFHPLHIIQNLINKLESKAMNEMTLWARGFQGQVEFDHACKRFVSYGCVQLDPKTKATASDLAVVITELPIGKWTEDYKQFLQNEMNAKGLVKSFSEHHTDVNIRFDVILRRDVLPFDDNQPLIDLKSLTKVLKLESYITVNNMTLFDTEGHIKQYGSALDIIEEYYPVRLAYYQKRKQYQLAEYQADLKLLGNKLKFLKHFVSEKGTSNIAVFAKKKREEMVGYLRDELGIEAINDSYNYVLNLPLLSLTVENMERMQKQFDEKQNLWTALSQRSPENLWLEDLRSLHDILVKAKEDYVQ